MFHVELLYICKRKLIKIVIMDSNELNTIINFINNVAFPIACCFCLFWYLVGQSKELKKTIDKNTEILKELTIIIKEKIK